MLRPGSWHNGSPSWASTARSPQKPKRKQFLSRLKPAVLERDQLRSCNALPKLLLADVDDERKLVYEPAAGFLDAQSNARNAVDFRQLFRCRCVDGPQPPQLDVRNVHGPHPPRRQRTKTT